MNKKRDEKMSSSCGGALTVLEVVLDVDNDSVGRWSVGRGF